MLNPLNVFLVVVGLLSLYNLVKSVYNSDANFRRKIIAHIDREIGAIELNVSSSRQFETVDSRLAHHDERIASIQGQVNQLKGKQSATSNGLTPSHRKRGEGLGALLEANKATESEENTPNEDVPHYLNYV